MTAAPPPAVTVQTLGTSMTMQPGPNDPLPVVCVERVTLMAVFAPERERYLRGPYQQRMSRYVGTAKLVKQLAVPAAGARGG